MRYTDEQLDALTRGQLVDVLQKGQQSLVLAAQAYDGVNQCTEKEKAVQERYVYISHGSQRKKGVVIGVVSFILLWIILHSFFDGLIFAALLTVVVLFADRKIFAQKYLEKAEAYRQSTLPAILDKKNQFQARYNEMCSTDDVINLRQLLPKEYFKLDAINAVTSILQTRRANTLGEALNVYEDQLHRKKLEEMEMQKVQAAQEAAMAQQRAAYAQEQSAEAQKRSAKAVEKSAREQSMAVNNMNMAIRDLNNSQRAMQSQSRASSGGGGAKMVKCGYCGAAKIAGTTCPHCGHQVGPMDLFIGGEKPL